jgi:hypothetical protein
VVHLLAEHKATGGQSRACRPIVCRAAIAPWFERAIAPSDGEPGLEQPCVARRGRVQELDRAFLHFCVECGAYGAFGTGVNLRAGRLGRWFCAAHRPGVKGIEL